MRLGTFSTAFLFALSIKCLSQAGQPPAQFATIHEAYKAAMNNLVSGSGSGSYEIYVGRTDKGAKLELKVKAKTKVFFDHGKFHIRLDYEKDDLHRLESRVIICDGTAILVNRTSKIFKPAHSEGEVYEANTRLSVMRRTGFDYNPCQLPSNILDIDMLSKKDSFSNWTITQDAKMNYSGNYTYSAAPNLHGSFLAAKDADYNVIEYSLLRADRNGFVVEKRQATWERRKNVWYVKSIDTQSNRLDGRSERMIFEYSSFEPNVEVPPSLFNFDAASLAPTARLIDRRPNAEDPVLHQPKTPKAEAAKLDTLAEAVKSLNPSSTPPPQRSTLVRYLLLAMGLLFCVLGLLFIWRRRIRKGNITPET